MEIRIPLMGQPGQKHRISSRLIADGRNAIKIPLELIKTAALTVAYIAFPIKTGTICGAISEIAPWKYIFAMDGERKPLADIIFPGAKTKIAPEVVPDTI